MLTARSSAASTDPESARAIVCRAAFSAPPKIKGHRWNSPAAKCLHRIMQMRIRWERRQQQQAAKVRIDLKTYRHLCLQCANEAGLFTNVDQCMSTALGTKLQLRAEQITKRYSPSFVPTIVYNHVSNIHTYICTYLHTYIHIYIYYVCL